MLNKLLFALLFLWQLPQNLVALLVMPFLGKLTFVDYRHYCVGFAGTRFPKNADRRVAGQFRLLPPGHGRRRVHHPTRDGRPLGGLQHAHINKAKGRSPTAAPLLITVPDNCSNRARNGQKIRSTCSNCSCSLLSFCSTGTGSMQGGYRPP